MPDELMIDDDTTVNPVVWTSGARGLVARPADVAVRATSFSPKSIPLIPREQWPDRIADMERSKSRLSDIILGSGVPSKDQNDPRYMNTRNPRWGYCWMFGPVGAVESLRAVMNQPRVSLSAFGAAYTIKGGRDEGGWGALSLDFLIDRGVPSEKVWPNFAADMSLDNAETWADAAQHKVTESWVDLTSPVYDRDMTLDQKMTLLLSRIPVVCDYMWWGHCVYSCDPVDADPSLPLSDVRRWGSRDRNSWGDSYGDRGFFLVKGQRCVPDNAVAPSVVMASTT